MDYFLAIGSFCIGTVGALVVVWLRWIGTLPRFSSSVEIEGCEEEYSKVKGCISRKIDENKEITQAETDHSNSLRDDIWRQRITSFTTAAVLYAVLGGATALLFVGLDIQNITEPANVIKLVVAGAVWTSFYSFLDVKKTLSTVESKKGKIDDGIVAKTSDIAFQLQEEKNRVLEYAKQYNEILAAYKEETTALEQQLTEEKTKSAENLNKYSEIIKLLQPLAAAKGGTSE